MQPMKVLLEGVVDYAGLFPPAELGMDAAVGNYAEYRRSPAGWMLGRFIVPTARLGDFEKAAATRLPRRPADEPWLLSALAGSDVAVDVAVIGEFNCRHAADGAGAALIDTLELRADTPDRIAEIARLMPSWAAVFVEVPLDPDPGPLLAAVAGTGLRAKARTGGVTSDAIPSTAAVARFLAACVRHRVPFKATAGLHHPVRGGYPLTYEADAPRATMHGFLNVFLAAALLDAGGTETEARSLLEETDAGAFRADGAAVHWRGRTFTAARLATTRRLATSFGSCSFTEPLADLATLNLG